jgi:hypothetical protein
MKQSDYDTLKLDGEWLCDVELVASPDSPGTINSPWGATNVGYIEDGEFNGPAMKGKVRPGGGDWPTISNDGQNSYKVDVRAVWETNDGALIYVSYYGFIAVPPERANSQESLAALDPSEYYFRTSPTFRTGDKRYLYLNKLLTVGIGRFTPTGLGYRIFRIT